MQTPDPILQVRDFPKLAVDSSLETVQKIPELFELFQELTISTIEFRIIDKEFDLLNKLTLNDEQPDRFIIGTGFQQLNRYQEIPVLAHTNVRIDENSELTPNNYINANYLLNPFEQTIIPKYIATQGPLQQTTRSFWEMTEKHKVTHILAIVEKKSMPNKCWNYWISIKPEEIGYLVEVIEVENNEFVDRRKLKVTNLTDKNQFEVIHLHLHDWIDHQLIAEEHYKDYIKLMDTIYQQDNNLKEFSLVVHCSAGVGRTGTFYASYFLFGLFLQSLLKKREFRFSVLALTRFLREQRYFAVENRHQYAFLYKFCQLIQDNKLSD